MQRSSNGLPEVMVTETVQITSAGDGSNQNWIPGSFVRAARTVDQRFRARIFPQRLQCPAVPHSVHPNEDAHHPLHMDFQGALPAWHKDLWLVPGPGSNRYARCHEAADFRVRCVTNFTTRASAYCQQNAPTREMARHKWRKIGGARPESNWSNRICNPGHNSLLSRHE